MGIGDRLLDTQYRPDVVGVTGAYPVAAPYFVKTTKCPVKFTDDIIEYVVSKDFLGYSLRPLQRTFLENFFYKNPDGTFKYDAGVVCSGMRSGKCVHLNTQILMYDGTLKLAKDIVVGDLVMGPDSKHRTVLETSRGTSELFEVKQSCADTYIVNDAHILSLKKAQSVKCEKSKYGYERYVGESNIVNIPIKEYLNKSDKWKYFFRGYKAGFINFKKQSVTIDPYLLGMWLTDGNANELRITKMEKDIKDWIYAFAKDNNLIVKTYQKKGTLAKSYYFDKTNGKSNIIWNEFKKLDLHNNKHIPQCYITNNKEIRLALLAAIIDGDGHSHKHGYDLVFANERLARDVKRLADTLGYRTRIKKRKTSCINKVTGYYFIGEGWRVTIYGNVWEIPCKVERKKYINTGTCTNKEEGLSSLRIKSIGIGDYAGIMVDGDNLYCLADCTVTHNSWMAAYVVTFLTQYMLQFDQPAAHFGQGPGTRLTAQTIASSSEQTKETVYAHVETMLHYSPWWQKYLAYLKDLELVDGKDKHYQEKRLEQNFPNKNIAILSLHSNSAALAGKTSYCVVFDELSRFDVIEGSTQSKTQKRTADAVYSTASRAASSLKQISKVLTISSPMFEDDYTMKLLYMAKDCWIGEQATVINALRDKVVVKDIKLYGMHATTFEFNPLTPENIVGFAKGIDFESYRIQNPEAYKRDYLAIPPSTVNPYFEYPERIDMVTVANHNPLAMFSDKIIEESIQAEHGYEFRHYVGKTVLPLRPNKMTKHYICVDQGEVKDHFVLAMGHAEEIPIKTTEKINMPSTRLKIIIDLLEGWVPDKEKRVTVSFENVEEVIKSLCHYFLVGKVTYDAYSSVESIQRLFSAGIYTERLGATLEMYDVLKQLIYQGQIELPSNARLVSELKHLSLIGGNKIDHDSAHCVIGDTRIKLLNGTCPTIKELSDKGIDNEFWVYAALPTGEVVPAKACNAHKTKSVMELCEVTLDNGETIQTTLDHLYMLRDGSYQQAQDLIAGESLMPLYTQIAKQKYLKGNAGNYEQIFFNNKWQYTHKVVSDYLGFGARIGEVIHHNDLKQRNNSPENLERLTKEVHSQRHMQICRKAFTPEAIAKRVAAYKKTYWASAELQKKAKERAKIFFNDPVFRAKTSQATREYNIKNKSHLRFRPWIDSKEFRDMMKERKISKETLVTNAGKLNNGYWKSSEGIARRKELSQTQLREASNKRTKESFIQGGKKRSTKAYEKLFSKIDYRFGYVLSYRHCVILYGGCKQSWKKWLPIINFKENAKKLIGKTDEEMLQLTGLSSRQLGVILSNLHMREVFSKRNHKVVSVRIIKLDNPIDVYDITVPGYDNFAIDSGIFIHNSKDYSDAVVRCAWSCYTDYITQTIHGNHMLPLKASLPTIRSVATAFELMKQDRLNPAGALWESFGANQALSGSGVFGETIIVMPNVMPNIGKK